MRHRDLVGQRFGQLVVIERVRTDEYKRSVWLCQCDCGGTRTTVTQYLNAGNSSRCYECGKSGRRRSRDYHRSANVVRELILERCPRRHPIASRELFQRVDREYGSLNVRQFYRVVRQLLTLGMIRRVGRGLYLAVVPGG